MVENLKSPFKIPSGIEMKEDRNEYWLGKKNIILVAAKKIKVAVIEKSKRIKKPEKVSVKRKLAVKKARKVVAPEKKELRSKGTKKSNEVLEESKSS